MNRWSQLLPDDEPEKLTLDKLIVEGEGDDGNLKFGAKMSTNTTTFVNGDGVVKKKKDSN